MQLVTLARHAMATRFEIVLHGENPISLRAAGEEALDEIERLESQLSLFNPTSEIAHLNARAARESVRVTPTLFALLEHAKILSEETGGAFDITIAPLMRCWGLMQRAGKIPSPEELAESFSKIGMHQLHLNRDDFTVRFERDGMMLDLGAIGKGYAVEKATELLREAGVTSALLHGGTSTVHAIGHPPDAEFWKVAVAAPEDSERRSPNRRAEVGVQASACFVAHTLKRGLQHASFQTSAPNIAATVPLKDASLSVSAVWGKSFQADGKTFGHVIDPRTGQPVSGALLAVVVLPSATETDALSTALLVSGSRGHARISSLRDGMRTLLICEDEERQLHVQAKGIAVQGESFQKSATSEKKPIETAA